LNPWYRHTNVPQAIREKDLRSFYLTRLGLDDERKNREILLDVIKRASSNSYVVVKKPKLSREIEFHFSQKPDSYPDPVSHLHGDIKSVKAFYTKPGYLLLTHGDLRGANFSVDNQILVWLDGYENVDWGSALADMAGLESILKFYCIDILNPVELYQFERAVLSPTHFDGLKDYDASALPGEMHPILRAIAHVRSKAKRMAGVDMEEYYANLFFFTMRELISEEIPSTRPSMPEIRKLHALLSSAMICYRLKNWDHWTGWPGGEKVPWGAGKP
jgi:hypothetical protein